MFECTDMLYYIIILLLYLLKIFKIETIKYTYQGHMTSLTTGRVT